MDQAITTFPKGFFADRDQGCRDNEPLSFVTLGDAIGHGTHAAGLRVEITYGATRDADLRKEQPQQVDDLARGTDGGTSVLNALALLDRDGGRQVRNQVDFGPRKPLEKLPSISRQRGDVTALPLGVEGIERERALPRTRDPGNHGQLAERDLARHAL